MHRPRILVYRDTSDQAEVGSSPQECNALWSRADVFVSGNSATTRTLHGTMTSQARLRRPGGITGLATTTPECTFHFVWSGLVCFVG